MISRVLNNAVLRRSSGLNNGSRSFSQSNGAFECSRAVVSYLYPVQRPISPHITIYDFPLTAMTSIVHRVTGVGLTGGRHSAGIEGADILQAPLPWPVLLCTMVTLRIVSLLWRAPLPATS